MSRYNTRATQRATQPARQVGPMRTTSRLGYTHGGAKAWVRDARSEYFLRLTTSFAGQKSYYESGEDRDKRLVELTQQLAIEDFDWLFDCLVWARTHGNQRTGPVTMAAEAVRARLSQGKHGGAEALVPYPVDAGTQPYASNRRLIDAVCQRADEPAEMIAYWKAKYNTQLPKPVKRGLADATRRLYNERNFLRYDSQASTVRMGDVLELVHTKPAAEKPWQGDLFTWAITSRHNRDAEPPVRLRAVHSRHMLNRLSGPSRVAMAHGGEMGDTVRLAMANQWEWLNSWLGSTDMSARERWELAIPEMGYMALLRNLRNFDQARISDAMVDRVIGRLIDPDEVARSRQLPFRFLSAYLEAPSDNWKRALNQAADHCLKNIPELDGGTLILVDVSGSMYRIMSDKSEMTMAMAGSLFGVALALKNRETSDVVIFGTYSKEVTIHDGASLLLATNALTNDARHDSSIGWSTNMGPAIQASFVKGKHQRVIIISDMQAFPAGRDGISGPVPDDVPIYCFNLSAYSNTPIQTGTLKRVDLGGLSDHTFSLIKQLETSATAGWPWE